MRGGALSIPQDFREGRLKQILIRRFAESSLTFLRAGWYKLQANGRQNAAYVGRRKQSVIKPPQPPVRPWPSNSFECDRTLQGSVWMGSDFLRRWRKGFFPRS